LNSLPARAFFVGDSTAAGLFDLGFDVTNRIRRLDVEDKSRFVFNVVIREGAAVLELLSGKDETLLIGWDALLVLKLGLDVVDGVGGFNVVRKGIQLRF
jgi:hypothetical protein